MAGFQRVKILFLWENKLHSLSFTFCVFFCSSLWMTLDIVVWLLLYLNNAGSRLEISTVSVNIKWLMQSWTSRYHRPVYYKKIFRNWYWDLRQTCGPNWCEILCLVRFWRPQEVTDLGNVSFNLRKSLLKAYLEIPCQSSDFFWRNLNINKTHIKSRKGYYQRILKIQIFLFV